MKECANCGSECSACVAVPNGRGGYDYFCSHKCADAKCGSVTDLRANVGAFHAATGIIDLDRPGVPTDDVVRLRARMLVEELFETLRAMFDHNFGDIEADLNYDVANRRICVSLPDYADGLADLMYIAEGGFLTFGIDSRPVHAEVQRANMAKAGGPVREDGKRLKPPGWTPPDIAGIIRRQQEIGDCAFCGRKAVRVRSLVAHAGVLVCIDPIRQPDKPLSPNCAWRYCARATDGKHSPGDDGACKDCGRPAIAPKVR
jgi:predicted HAD superfamily Cof-like phosphohydrolase